MATTDDLHCVQCGAPLPPGVHYCGVCGQALANAPDEVSRSHLSRWVVVATIAVAGGTVAVVTLFLTAEELQDGGDESAGATLRPNSTAVGTEVAKSANGGPTASTAASVAASEPARTSSPQAISETVAPAGSVTQVVASLPDLVPGSIGITVQDPGDCTQRDRLGMDVSVANRGKGPAPSFHVTLNARIVNFPGVAVGDSVSQWVEGHFPGIPVVFAVDPENAVPESDETNNVRTLQVPIPTPISPCTPAATGR